MQGVVFCFDRSVHLSPSDIAAESIIKGILGSQGRRNNRTVAFVVIDTARIVAIVGVADRRGYIPFIGYMDFILNKSEDTLSFYRRFCPGLVFAIIFVFLHIGFIKRYGSKNVMIANGFPVLQLNAFIFFHIGAGRIIPVGEFIVFNKVFPCRAVRERYIRFVRQNPVGITVYTPIMVLLSVSTDKAFHSVIFAESVRNIEIVISVRIIRAG